jgi:L-amino acid N-acyltransferase YncA
MTMADIQFAKLDDLSSLLLLASARDKSIRAFPDPGFWDKKLSASIDEKNLIVAIIDGEIIAFAHLSPFLWLASPNLFIQLVYVAEKYRRRGIASDIFKEAERIARSRGADTLYSSTDSDNLPSLLMHEALGFTRCGMISLGTVDEVFLKKPLF